MSQDVSSYSICIGYYIYYHYNSLYTYFCISLLSFTDDVGLVNSLKNCKVLVNPTQQTYDQEGPCTVAVTMFRISWAKLLTFCAFLLHQPYGELTMIFLGLWREWMEYMPGGYCQPCQTISHKLLKRSKVYISSFWYANFLASVLSLFYLFRVGWNKTLETSCRSSAAVT